MLDQCPAASSSGGGAGAGARPVLPFARASCAGAGCAHFLKPCAGDADCGGAPDSCRGWGLTEATWVDLLVKLGLLSDGSTAARIIILLVFLLCRRSPT